VNASVHRDPLPDLPYPGIEPFEYAQRQVFFAREAEVRTLTQLIILYRGVLLYSNSGMGKSSLINAGLVPAALAQGYRPERIRVQPKPDAEIVIERIPERSERTGPFLLSLFAPDQSSERVVLSVDDFLRTIRDATERIPHVHPLLVFDQFEEWVTLVQEAQPGQAAEAARIAQEKVRDAILSLLKDQHRPVKILISFREDYLAELSPLFDRCPRLSDHFLRLTPLRGDQIRRAIRGPFERYPGRYHPELGDPLADKIQTQFAQRSAGGDIRLTEVQIVCSSLFESGKEGAALEAHFDTAGVTGILEEYLEGKLAALTEAQQDMAGALLSRLVTSAGTRNTVARDDLLELARVQIEDGFDRESLGNTLDYLEQRTKLLRCERRREVCYYEIASEFLVEWIRAKAQERQHRAEQRKLVEAERRAEKKAEDARKWRLYFFLLLAALLVAVGSAAFAWWQRHVAQAQRRVAFARQLAAQADGARKEHASWLQRSVLLALESRSKAPTLDADQALRCGLASLGRPIRREMDHKGVVSSVVFSPNGRSLAAACSDGIARVWDVAGSGDPEEVVHGSPLCSVAFSPDGASLATAGQDGIARVWRLDTMGDYYEAQHLSHGGEISSIAFSPDGRYLATVGEPNTARIWDMTTGRKAETSPLHRHDGRVQCVAFSPDGQHLATGGEDKTARIWDLTTGKLITRINHVSPVQSAAFSPDGACLATAEESGTARLWDLNGEELAMMSHEQAINSVAFRPDGKYLATASADGTARLWDLDGEEAARISLEETVRSVAFSPDGKYLATADEGGNVWLWEAASREIVWEQREDLVASVAVSPGNQYVATAGKDSTKGNTIVRLWRTATGEMTILKHRDPVCFIVFSPKGDNLAVASGESAYLWRVADTNAPPIQMSHKEDEAGDVFCVAFSPNGAYLATASKDRTARVWKVATGEQAARLPKQEDYVTHVAFSPDGERLATTMRTGPIRVWEWESKKKAAELVPEGDVVCIAFSPDGKDLVAVRENRITVWNAATGREVARMEHKDIVSAGLSPDGKYVVAAVGSTVRLYGLAGRQEATWISQKDDVVSLAFSADGKHLAVVSGKGDIKVRRWWTETELVEEACRRLTRNLTYDEWRQYLSPQPYRPTVKTLPRP
jgi:WD40 repeat protein